MFYSKILVTDGIESQLLYTNTVVVFSLVEAAFFEVG
jgi:hypothetical protein